MRILHGTWDSCFAICGKSLDSLYCTDGIIEMQYDRFEYWLGQFQAEQKHCKFCLAEILHEAKLRRDKSPNFVEEIDDPVL